MSEPVVLRGVEVVGEDAEKLVAVYPYRDADATKVTTGTRETTFMTCGVPGIEWRSLVEAAETTRGAVARFCRGRGGKKEGGPPGGGPLRVLRAPSPW